MKILILLIIASVAAGEINISFIFKKNLKYFDIITLFSSDTNETTRR